MAQWSTPAGTSAAGRPPRSGVKVQWSSDPQIPRTNGPKVNKTEGERGRHRLHKDGHHAGLAPRLLGCTRDANAGRLKQPFGLADRATSQTQFHQPARVFRSRTQPAFVLCPKKTDPSAVPRRGIEQILATVDNTTLVVKATKDGKLDVMSNAFVEGEATIRDGGGLSHVRTDSIGGQVATLIGSAVEYEADRVFCCNT